MSVAAIRPAVAPEAPQQALRLCGLLHDLNNLLTIAMGATEAIAGGRTTAGELRANAAAGLRALEGSIALTDRLHSYCHCETVAPQVIEATTTMNAIYPLVRRAVGDDVAVAVAAERRRLECVVDGAELEAALVNLCINAGHAMPQGGILALSADAIVLDAGSAASRGVRAGSYVVFTVNDTGTGMSPATLQHAADPFFTTKGDRGSGLGLNNARTFAEKFGGCLEITSSEGRGAVVRLYLPRLIGDAEAGGRHDS